MSQRNDQAPVGVTYQVCGKGVDPAIELANLSGHKLGPTEGLGEGGGALVAGHEIDGQALCVASAHLGELLLCPIERDLD